MTPLCRRRRQALRQRKGVTMSSTTKEIDVTERSQRTEKARRGITMRATGRCGTLFDARALAGGGGKQGFLLQKTIATGRNLGLSRGIFGKDVKLAEIEGEEQEMRVQSAVKMAFLRVLAAQELLYARRDMAMIAQDAAETVRR